MRVAFRADSSEIIGTGHVMRDLALAEELAARGAKVRFICRHIEQPQIEAIRRYGFALDRLTTSNGASIVHRDPSTWLGVPWRRDADEVLAAAEAAGGLDWMVADHYGLDQAWHSQVRAAGCRLAVIDDLADRNYDCDLLVDQSVASDPRVRYGTRVPHSALVLSGPRFALLRSEFRKASKFRSSKDGTVRHILVSYGGIDRTGETLKALSVLASLQSPVSVDVVIGATNPRRDEIQDQTAALPFARLHIDTQHMAELALKADLAFGSAGGSALERCCLGLPSIITVSAANQMHGAQALGLAGAALVLGEASEVGVDQLRTALIGLMALPAEVRRMAKRATEICDGEGARRVVARMEALAIQLRPARPADCAALLEWRNHEATRRYAADANEISAAVHDQWFSRCLNDPATALLIAEDGRGAVGVLRYDFKESIATVSVYLVPERHGQGAGSVLLRLGEAWLARNRSDVRRIEAEVLADNFPSMAAFGEAGYAALKHTLYKEIG
jgi:UDP-2,4-diacetamido-2,4,6-trideoxy-beta-L-altropyranose hydrolase